MICGRWNSVGKGITEDSQMRNNKWGGVAAGLRGGDSCGEELKNFVAGPQGVKEI
jgi:hypothetical protein